MKIGQVQDLMIEQITGREKQEVERYLNQEPEFNLFILGDLANHGLDCEFLELWAQRYNNGLITAVILRYFGSYVVYAKEDFDEREVGTFLNARKEKIQALSGKNEVVIKILPYLDSLGTGKIMHFARLKHLKLEQMPATAQRWQVNTATLADLGKIAVLRAEIFAESKTVVRQILQQQINQGAGRAYYIEMGDEIVATAQTTAEYASAAMIVGVATAPKYRRMGMATACLYRLCQDLLVEGKSLCLFYDNPAAGLLYNRLGFEDIGFWRMVAAHRS